MTESILTLDRGKFESLADLNGGKVPQHEKREFPAVAENSLLSDFSCKRRLGCSKASSDRIPVDDVPKG